MVTGDLTTLENARQWLGLTGLEVLSISEANPAVVTLRTRPSTPLLNGIPYTIVGASGMALPDDAYIITTIDPVSFSIPFDSTAAGAYTGGAVVSITDPLVQRLISATSAFIQNWLNRVIASSTYTQTFNGQGGQTMVLPQWPITSIDAMSINGATIAARAPLAFPSTYSNGSGYTFAGGESRQVALTGWCFSWGYNNVYVQWVAGYLVQNEAQTVPASAPYVLTTLARWSAGDRGVTYADGTALVHVAGAPAQGEYAVDGSIYTFNAADAGAAVLISYAYVPYDIEQACLDTMGDWFKYQTRIGVTSQSIMGQSVTYTNYTNAGLPARARDVLQQYRRVI